MWLLCIRNMCTLIFHQRGEKMRLHCARSMCNFMFRHRGENMRLPSGCSVVRVCFSRRSACFFPGPTRGFTNGSKSPAAGGGVGVVHDSSL